MSEEGVGPESGQAAGQSPGSTKVEVKTSMIQEEAGPESGQATVRVGTVGTTTATQTNSPDEENEVNWLDGWDNNQLRRLQEKDPEVGVVLKWLQEGKARPSTADLLAYGSGIHAICSVWSHLEIHKVVVPTLEAKASSRRDGEATGGSTGLAGANILSFAHPEVWWSSRHEQNIEEGT